MECGRYIQLLSARLDGELTEQESRELEAHLAQCPDCRALGAELEALSRSFDGLEDVPAPQGFAQGVMERVRAAEGERKKAVPLFRRPQIRALTGLAACALLCVGLYQSGLLDGAQERDAAASLQAAPRAAGGETGAALYGKGAPEEEPALAEAAIGAEDARAEPEGFALDDQAAYETRQTPQVEPEAIRSAADQVLEQLGGTAAYPGAVWDEETYDYLLAQGGTAEESWSLWLLYTFPSPNGEYLTFVLRRDSEQLGAGPEGASSAAFLNRFAVPIEGGGLLSLYDQEGNRIDSPAYHQAIGEGRP